MYEGVFSEVSRYRESLTAACGKDQVRGAKSLLPVCRPSLGLVMGVDDKAQEPWKIRKRCALAGPRPGWSGRVWGWPYGLLVLLGDACEAWVTSVPVFVCSPRAGMPCLASVPACILSSAPLLMTSTRSCLTWEPLSSPQQGKGMNSVGRRKPSAAGPCKPSRSVHRWSCLTAWTGCCDTLMPRTSALGGHPGWHDPCPVL